MSINYQSNIATPTAPFINVGAYPGVRSDLINDDANGINNAISSSPFGSLIWFPGNHLVGSTILLLPNRSYMGPMGFFNGSTFKQKNGANLPAVVASTDWYNNNPFSGFPLRMYGIAIDGNSANNTGTHGIALTNFNTILEGCSVSNAPGTGILLSANTRNNALIANGMVQSYVSHCVTSSSGGVGIAVADSSHGKVTDGYLLSNQVDTAGLSGIIMDTAGGWRVENNHVNSPQQHGINAISCFNTFFRGNYIDGFGFNSGAGPGTFYNGIGAGTLAGPPTIIANNIVRTTAVVANTTYQFISGQATDNTGQNNIGVYDNLCFGANVANQNAFAFDGHLIAQPFVASEWGNVAINFPTANTYSLNTNVTFAGLQSQSAIKPNNSSTIFSGTGVPAVGLGVNGDFYFRTDTPGTANQRMYIKAAGAWSALTI